jgi:hypothetical protein
MTISIEQFTSEIKNQYGDINMSGLHQSDDSVSVELNGGAVVRHSNGKWGVWDSCAGLIEADTLANADAEHSKAYDASYEF